MGNGDSEFLMLFALTVTVEIESGLRAFDGERMGSGYETNLRFRLISQWR